MNEIVISQTMMDWASKKLSRSIQDMAFLLSKNPKKHDSIIQGKLTINQAIDLSKALNIPFGFLFLESPPETQKITFPDLRQKPNPAPLSSSFFETLKDIENKLTWYSQYLTECGAENLKFVGKYKEFQKTAPQEVAKDIARTISFNEEDRKLCNSYEDFYGLLTKKIEDQRILVFKSGISKNSSKKPLNVEEFRGFAIANELTPAIFINGKDSPSAWIFTLIHEVAHIWIGESGVSDNSASTVVENKGAEKFCDQVAAEFLTPRNEFLHAWGTVAQETKIISLSRLFKVSRLVIAKRAYDFNLIDYQHYRKIYLESNVKKDTESGGNPYANFQIRSSKRFTNTIVNSALAGDTLLKEAAKLLNVKPGTVLELHKRAERSRLQKVN